MLKAHFLLLYFKTNSYKLGWYLKTVFAIGLDKKDLSLLSQLQESFGGIGNITIDNNRNSVVYSVTKLEDLINIVIPLPLRLRGLKNILY